MSVVFALATPPAKSAICIFRVSGPGCLDAIKKITGSGLKKARTFYLRPFLDSHGGVVDRVGVVFFKGPESYTGEDSFEVYAHGGLGVMSLIVDVFKGLGFDEAPPGEFTKRAFLNNKISLNEAEAVVDVIDSSNREGVYLSTKSLSGTFTDAVVDFSKRIDFLRVGVEGEIDFSDEGEDFLNSSLIGDLDKVVADFSLFVDGCVGRKHYSTKNKILFVGPVNSGKSSVFNRLLGFERALVSSVAGTTRDLVESEMFYNNASFSLLDSAGIRETDDLIESRGIDIALSQVGDADVVVGVFDSFDNGVLNKFSTLARGKNYLSVFNKLDLGPPNQQGFDCLVSAKTGEGFGELKNMLAAFFKVYDKGDYSFLVRDRHISLFNSSLGCLKKASSKIEKDEGLELVAEDLRLARGFLDEVVGIKSSDSLLGDIFSSFCIGK
ncbi:tRNA uridine-5-carboxymethylaminomethyl(34) synthesis GTPase MnmE [Gammaproteobacteria bacterium]|nr:tRNA uridine-5-carboxymethylaminomethyl(34) synthesis GTPase MnmE [Gammaproteobacteria bacterium]